MRIDVNNDNKVSVSKVNEIDKNVTKSTGADKNEIFDAGVMTMKFSDVNKSSKKCWWFGFEICESWICRNA